ncbi:MAG: MerR family transcriptional regulator, partial [Bacteroidetes bacterium]
MKENHYSIKDLENLTHIKAHTIRIWEQRYKILTPQRTSTNIRYYTDNDLRKILNVNTLYTNGLKISKIAALSESDILKKVEELIDNNKMLPD